MTNTDGHDTIEETGNEITYDEIGNPLTYYNGMEFKWTMGRRLESVKNGNTNVSYTYNVDGLRTSKTVNNVKYNYYWDGDKLTGQTWQGNTLYFYYDKDGNPIGFDLNNNNYYYVTNLQGDIIAILSSSNGLLAEYEYDAWGNCTILYDTNDIADINPLRYRGYYYDTDTNLYYLQSRYYDSNIGRFINSDEAVMLAKDTSTANLYNYTNNNPVNDIDPNGHWVVSIGVEATAACVFGVCAAYSVCLDENGNFAVMATVGVTIMFNIGASIGIYASFYPAYKSINNIKGWGFSTGVSWMAGLYLGGNGSFDISKGKFTNAVGVSFGAGVSVAPIPTLYVKATYSKVIWKFNITKFIKSKKTKTFSVLGVKFTLKPFKKCARLTCNKNKTKLYIHTNKKLEIRR